jgi:hypothetical protein
MAGDRTNVLTIDICVLRISIPFTYSAPKVVRERHFPVAGDAENESGEATVRGGGSSKAAAVKAEDQGLIERL